MDDAGLLEPLDRENRLLPAVLDYGFDLFEFLDVFPERFDSLPNLLQPFRRLFGVRKTPVFLFLERHNSCFQLLDPSLERPFPLVKPYYPLGNE